MVGGWLALLLSAGLWHAAVCDFAPSVPEPGTVWQAGKEYDVIWEEDGAKPAMEKNWKNFKIDLMTGDNMEQTLLTNVASNLTTANGATAYKWTVPDVSPHAPIYFLMFTNEQGENAWTTRFAIVGDDKKQETPEHAQQPTGEKIPWGVGKLAVDPSAKVAAATAQSQSANASQPASASASGSGVPTGLKMQTASQKAAASPTHASSNNSAAPQSSVSVQSMLVVVLGSCVAMSVFI